MMTKKKDSTTGTMKWRCSNCGEVETTSDDPIELTESGPPMCPECVDREGDQQALGNAAEVVQASIKLLQEYGEQDEWMGEMPT